MKGIKNLNVVKEKIIPLLLAGSLSLTLASCSKEVEMSSMTFEELLAIEEIQDVTLIDELIEDGKLQYDSTLTIIQAADQLEKYMTIVEKLKEVDFTGVEELRKLTDEEYKSTLNLSLESINQLISTATNKDTSLRSTEDRLVALKQLDYLYRYCIDWINQNGQNIAVEIMMASIKTSVGEEFEVTPEQYYTITIQPRYGSKEDGPREYYISIGDTTYKVPIASSELWNTMDYIYEIQGANIAEEKEYETYRKAMNYAKTTMAAGTNIKNGELEAQYDSSYIEKKFVK